MREGLEAEARAASLRVGLIAAAIYNVNRKKGTRAFQPKDFLKERPKVLTPEQMEKVMDGWATSHNRRRKD